MKQTREVSKTEKIIFPIVVATIFVAILLPLYGPPHWLLDAGQSVPGVRCDRPAV